uniref:Uncharacterized protein n=1 Tax=Arundo donax TaxID=35708 RepID=A0A0A9DXC8_ARUDO
MIMFCSHNRVYIAPIPIITSEQCITNKETQRRAKQQSILPLSPPKLNNEQHVAHAATVQQHA